MAVTMAPESRLPVRDDGEIVGARRAARALAATLGFSETDLTMIATAVSEIARNMVEYGGGGEMTFAVIDGDGRVPGRRGLRITATDHGPGIPDVERAMQDGYTTGRGLGLGLPGARRLMDEFRVESAVGVGTTVSMTKWVV